MRGTELEIAAADGVADSYLVGPAEGEPRAGVLFCMGGRIAWRIAAADLDCEAYLGFADQDASVTAEQIAELEGALGAGGASYRSDIYAFARHGYTMADVPAYDEAARERHFREVFALLDRALAGS